MSDMNEELTLHSGKKAVFRSTKIADEEAAAMAVPAACAKDKYTYGVSVQMEIIRMRLVSVDGKRPNATQLTDMDSLFTTKEFKQIVKYLDSEEGKILAPQVTQVKPSGGA